MYKFSMNQCYNWCYNLPIEASIVAPIHTKCVYSSVNMYIPVSHIKNKLSMVMDHLVGMGLEDQSLISFSLIKTVISRL